MADVLGGTITNGRPWRTCGTDGDVRDAKKFLAQSKHTGEAQEFFSYGAASYWLETIHERFEACLRRTGAYPSA